MKKIKIFLVAGLVFTFLSLGLITWIGFSAANYLSSEIKNLRSLTQTQNLEESLNSFIKSKELHCLFEAKNLFLSGDVLNKSVLENYDSIIGCFNKDPKVCNSAICDDKEQKAI